MRRLTAAAGFLLLLSAPLAATEMAAPSPYQATLVANFDYAAGHLIELAEAIPADTYGWRPAEGVRSVSEVFMHVASANLLLPPGMGVAPMEGLVIPENPFELAGKWEAEVTAKDAVIAKLRESIAYARSAIESFPDDRLDEEVNVIGMPMSCRAMLLVVLSHNHEHLGQAIAYARSNGVVPPWSRKESEE